MIKKLDNYKHIIYECKTDEEVIKSQDIAFKGGWRWSNGTTLKRINRIKCIVLQCNNKIECSSDWSSRQIVDHYNNDSCLVVKSLSDLNLLVNGINYNKKRELVYE